MGEILESIGFSKENCSFQGEYPVDSGYNKPFEGSRNLNQPGSPVTTSASCWMSIQHIIFQRARDMCQGLNSHYFHIIGDKLINPIVRAVYIPIIRIPSLKVGGLPSPIKRDF